MNKASLWPDERVEKLTKLWDQGVTTPRIAEALGTTPNAIAGKVHRMGLKKRVNQQGIMTDRARHKASVTRYPIKHHMTVKKEQNTARKLEINSRAFGTLKPIMELERDDCRWPIRGMYCCGKISKGSYCKEHASIAYIGGRGTE